MTAFGYKWTHFPSVKIKKKTHFPPQNYFHKLSNRMFIFSWLKILFFYFNVQEFNANSAIRNWVQLGVFSCFFHMGPKWYPQVSSRHQVVWTLPGPVFWGWVTRYIVFWHLSRPLGHLGRCRSVFQVTYEWAHTIATPRESSPRINVSFCPETKGFSKITMSFVISCVEQFIPTTAAFISWGQRGSLLIRLQKQGGFGDQMSCWCFGSITLTAGWAVYWWPIKYDLASKLP